MYYAWHVKSNWTAWDSVAVTIAAVTLYGVWRLWRGMRLDAFERSIRSLRQQPQTKLTFPRRPRTASTSTGILQISLLPLMLISAGLAILLAQTQRPDDLSRAVTWMLFVTVGTWYATGAWPARRGVGPLRNFAFAGVASAALISAALWTFYIGVDWFRGDGTFTRLTASGPVLLWWTAMGGVVGAILGALRSHRIYAKVNLAESSNAEWSAAEVAVHATRAPRAKWPAMLVACGASLLFHVSAAPHLYREVYIHYWYWGDFQHDWNNSLSLTMAPVSAPSLHTQYDTLHASLPLNYYPVYSEPFPTSSEATAINSYANNAQIAGRPVYVASQAIRSGQRINANMVKLESWPVDKIPDGVSVRTNVNQLVGTIASVDMVPGELIADSKIFRPNVPEGSDFGQSDFGPFREVINAIGGTTAAQGPVQQASPGPQQQRQQLLVEIEPPLGNAAGPPPIASTQGRLPGSPDPLADLFDGPSGDLPPGLNPTIGAGELPNPILNPTPVSASDEQGRVAIQRIDSGVQAMPTSQQPTQAPARPGGPIPQPPLVNATGSLGAQVQQPNMAIPQPPTGPRNWPLGSVAVPPASSEPQLSTPDAFEGTSQPTPPIATPFDFRPRKPSPRFDPVQVQQAPPSDTIDPSALPPADSSAAKPSNTTVDVKRLQIEGGIVRHPNGFGMLVQKVTQGGIADQLGIQSGDVILLDEDNDRQSWVVLRDSQKVTLRLPQRLR